MSASDFGTQCEFALARGVIHTGVGDDVAGAPLAERHVQCVEDELGAEVDTHAHRPSTERPIDPQKEPRSPGRGGPESRHARNSSHRLARQIEQAVAAPLLTCRCNVREGA